MEGKRRYPLDIYLVNEFLTTQVQASFIKNSMKKWFILDTHFSHKNIIKYTGRPYEIVEENYENLTYWS